MDKKIAIFPGTFDPVHFGHIDVVKQATQIFDTVIWLIGENTTKKPMFSLDQRIKMLEITRKLMGFQNVEISSSNGLLARFAEKAETRFIVRSLRSSMDFEYEYQMTLVNRKIFPDLITIYIPARQDYIHISSSAVRELIRNGELISEYIPPSICDYIGTIYSK
ncbi:pantetheine-phosphate adenylyltransferase [Candidatus Parcubacteria bacterium]|jgi:pantetheine-phosphate adenylyltransferase|nr:MAG: pantetheine-phosphate adenylyltransferase [Candidatus Parcubacteria bacterium]